MRFSIALLTALTLAGATSAKAVEDRPDSANAIMPGCRASLSNLNHHRCRPPLSTLGVGSNWSRAPVDPNRRQCIALELTAEVASSRRNSAS